MPTQIQPKTVKTVEIEPESAVPDVSEDLGQRCLGVLVVLVERQREELLSVEVGLVDAAVHHHTRKEKGAT